MALRVTTSLVLSALILGGAPGTAPAAGDGETVTLDQGLGAEERRRFYHLSVGSQLLPLSVLRALKDPATGRHFLEDPERFGMLPDPDDPDGLPIGLTQEHGRGSSVLGPIAGINCAACHVAELRHDGKAVRIDGAASLMDFERFSADLSRALEALKKPATLAGFVTRLTVQPGASAPLEPKSPAELSGLPGVAPQPDEETFSAAVKARLTGWVERLEQTRRLFGGKLDFFGRIGRMDTGHPAGPGRTDDWVLARNLLFDEDAWLERGTASASYPALWGYDDYEWLTWNGATRSGMERGVATVMGLGALYDADYESTVSPAAIVEQDRLAAKIEAPKWPEEVLGPIDRGLAETGAAVYAEACARCHDRAGAYSYDEVGTDTVHADSFAIPVGAKAFDGRFEAPGQPSFADALSAKIARYTAEAYAQEGWSDMQIEAVAPMEDEVWKPVRQVVSRPLRAVWATAPYLSNGSVPTIEALLAPPAERPKAFPLGHYDYDPERLGYRTDIAEDDAIFWFDTTLEGNSARGHEYGTDLAEEERRALIEFLKTQ
ncbi:MAG TPA: di-heme-cytochrome C peroxidase [Thermohalobaculum sp.]|nr:di-heme-cytochrome C peroxidase [Thermohalobaculum sp.]